MYIAAHQWHCTQRNTCIDIVFSNSKWVWRGQFSSVLQLCALIKACSDAKKNNMYWIKAISIWGKTSYWNAKFYILS